MLERQIERLRRARALEALVVATSTDTTDDAIASLCAELNVDCFRGSLEDVLDRFCCAARQWSATTAVRLTGDCPLADWSLIDHLVHFHLDGGYDYASNTLSRSYPDGLDVEVVQMHCLEEAWRESELPSEREHVTPFIYHHPERYRLGNLAQSRDLSSMRWVVDEPADLDFVVEIYEALYPLKPAFGTDDILTLLEKRLDIAGKMGRAKMNEGYDMSLLADAAAAAARKGAS